MLFEFVRNLLCPFTEIEKVAPKKGKILDVGCGHGIFSRMLATSGPQRKILGIDPSSKKIALAQTTTNPKNLSFKTTYLQNIREKNFQSIIIIDVLYLLPPEEKKQMLKISKKLLDPKGKLIIKLEVTKPRWLLLILEIEEKIMVKLIKYTFSNHSQFYYMDVEEYKKILLELGFKIKLEKTLKSLIPYQHPLIVAIPH